MTAEDSTSLDESTWFFSCLGMIGSGEGGGGLGYSKPPAGRLGWWLPYRGRKGLRGKWRRMRKIAIGNGELKWIVWLTNSNKPPNCPPVAHFLFGWVACLSPHQPYNLNLFLGFSWQQRVSQRDERRVNYAAVMYERESIRTSLWF